LKLHPPQKLQRPENFPVCVTCLSTDVGDFQHPKTKNFSLASFLTRKKMLHTSQAIFSFFLARILRKMKNCQHHHKGKPHTPEKSQDAATSLDDEITDTVHTSRVDTSCVCT
jgi:hypothetical protein